MSIIRQKIRKWLSVAVARTRRKYSEYIVRNIVSEEVLTE